MHVLEDAFSFQYNIKIHFEGDTQWHTEKNSLKFSSQKLRNSSSRKDRFCFLNMLEISKQPSQGRKECHISLMTSPKRQLSCFNISSVHLIFSFCSHIYRLDLESTTLLTYFLSRWGWSLKQTLHRLQKYPFIIDF